MNDTNYIVAGSVKSLDASTPLEKMDPIPDHAIHSPFGRLSTASIVNDDRFIKYRAHIVTWYRELYDKYMYCKGGYTCSDCGSYLTSTKSGKILGHLASLKHLKAVGVADEIDQRKRRVKKHTPVGAPTPLEK